ncbi:MAG: GNAT family N-acetyltransferase [Faecalibacterium sp.]
MELVPIPGGFGLRKEREQIGRCMVRPTAAGAALDGLCVLPQWRRKGYGSYLLREVLRRYGGFDRETATVFTAPLPAAPGEGVFWAKFGFSPEGGCLVRRRTPDLTAVRFVQDWLAARFTAPPRLCIDATCGNGGDTAFLCRLTAPEGRVLGFDIQPAAIASTRARLQTLGTDPARYALYCDSHEHLLQYVELGSADLVMFNFGWLPGADHTVYSTAGSSLPALEAALDALRPGGALSAILYSGQVIGSGEKQAVLAWLRALPLSRYTVLVCEFANWADTAPLPCFVLKK